MLLYIHIPFCIKKCAYCDFLSVPADGEKVSLYVKSLIEDIRQSSEKYKRIETIYIGGGTPSFIDASYISEILDTVRKHYEVAADAEITIEVNPCSVTMEKLSAYKKAGINRISMGVQSFDNDALKTLGRVHDAETAVKAFFMIRQAGFDNVSLDLISCIPGESSYNNGHCFGTSVEKSGLPDNGDCSGTSADSHGFINGAPDQNSPQTENGHIIPDQNSPRTENGHIDLNQKSIKTENGYILINDIKSFEASLEMIRILNPEHVSVYQLIIEEGTPFYKQFGPDSGYVRDEDEEAYVYIKTSEFLKQAGYEHYEISNYAKPGKRSAHNCGYWQQKDYIGCGAGAVGCVKGIRYRKHSDLEAYIKDPNHTNIEERLTSSDLKKEYAMLGLRMIDGISEEEYRLRFGSSFEPEIKTVLNKYMPEYVAFENGRYHFTEKGFLVSNAILTELL